MNEQQLPCEIWLEAISLLAAECLAGPEEEDLQDHLSVCHACRHRYEEIVLVCSSVRIAKPVVDQERVLAMGRCLQHLPWPAKDVTQKHRSVPLRVAMLASAAMVLIGVLSQLAFRQADDNPDKPTAIVQLRPHVAPVETADLQLPTMFALRRAAAESDESLDRLLALYSKPSLLEPLNSHTFRPELLQ